jgi:hypothetical protein
VRIWVAKYEAGSFDSDVAAANIVQAQEARIGRTGANDHLRQSLVFLNMPVLQEPEACIGNGVTLFLQDGSVVNEKTWEHERRSRARPGYLASGTKAMTISQGNRWRLASGQAPRVTDHRPFLEPFR